MCSCVCVHANVHKFVRKTCVQIKIQLEKCMLAVTCKSCAYFSAAAKSFVIKSIWCSRQKAMGGGTPPRPLSSVNSVLWQPIFRAFSPVAFSNLSECNRIHLILVGSLSIPSFSVFHCLFLSPSRWLNLRTEINATNYAINFLQFCLCFLFRASF